MQASITQSVLSTVQIPFQSQILRFTALFKQWPAAEDKVQLRAEAVAKCICEAQSGWIIISHLGGNITKETFLHKM